jgi:hypothetical protein
LQTVSTYGKTAAARWAADIIAGRLDMEIYRRAVDNLMADPEARLKYTLDGLRNQVDIWVNRAPQVVQAAQAAPKAASPPEDESWVGKGLRMQAAAMGIDLASLR